MQKSRIFASISLQNDVHKTRIPNQPAVAVLRPGVAAEPDASTILLSNKKDWDVFEEAFEGLYCTINGRSTMSIRRIVGLLILKYVHNVSDDSIWDSDLLPVILQGAINTDVCPMYPDRAREVPEVHRGGRHGADTEREHPGE